MEYCKNCGMELSEGEPCNCQETVSSCEQNVSAENVEINEEQSSIPMDSNIDEETSTKGSVQNALNQPINIDFSSAVEFFKQYIKSPKNAVKTANDNNDWTSLIVCSVCLIISMTVSQFSIWGLSHVFSGYYFLFGVLFALFAAALPFASNYAIARLNKVDIAPKDLLFRVVLRTPIWSVTLLLIGVAGAIGFKEFLIAVVLCLVVYSVSQLSVLLEIFKNKRNNSLVMGIIAVVFILFAYFLVKLELKAAGKVIMSTIYQYLWY